MTTSATDAFKEKAAEFKAKFADAFKAFGDIGASSKETYEALTASFNTTVKAVEGVNAETSSYTKKAVEDAVAATKAVLAAKSLKEVVAIQNDYTKSAFDGYLTYSNKIGELTVTSAQEAIEPISRQISINIKKFAVPLSA